MNSFTKKFWKCVLKVEHTVYVMSGYRLEGYLHKCYYRSMSRMYREYFENNQKKQQIRRLLQEGSFVSKERAYKLAAELDMTVAEMQSMEQSLIKA